ncbi:urease accessory protein UreD [Microseira wollei]|uniref:Urease accessory protein UreD n=1 Tax=Microseira wollei NIES-4236 TaxID=2530354 RepID=A0AAV3XI93_9CYAN|nr:urease accessory protein UreD [Microseira wollei]GET39147.1 urease accessory protein UreD [Microseira wollei NIES-4236]
MNQIPKTTDNLSWGWHGSLDLAYARRRGVTQVIYNQAQAPLKVQRPFYPEGEEVCHSVILHTAGGMVGSDRLSFNFHLQKDAQALITTTAASKIYRSNGQTAQISMQMQLDAGANLEWLPQETIIFNGAIYRQDMRVELAPGASWLAWEITRFGRSARGEKFWQGEWRSNTEIWQQGRPLWIDRQRLFASEETINSPHSLAGYPIVASLTWVGQPATPELVEKARNLWQTHPPLNKGGAGGGIGVTRLTEGLLCRYRGNSTTEVRNWFIAVWHLLRQSFLERPAILPRVWQR